MNTINLKNQYGETIQVTREPDDQISVYHSDITPEGESGEFVDVGITVAGKEVIGATLMVGGKPYILNAEEAHMIREAIKQLSGEQEA